MFALIVTVHVLVSLFLIFVILLQPGKGDGLAFGGGSSSTVFGGQGSTTFLAKVTEVCAAIFMITSLTLAYRSSHSDSVLRARRNLAAESKTAPTTGGPAVPATQAPPATTGSGAPPAGQAAPAPATNQSATPTPAPAQPNK